MANPTTSNSICQVSLSFLSSQDFQDSLSISGCWCEEEKLLGNDIQIKDSIELKKKRVFFDEHVPSSWRFFQLPESKVVASEVRLFFTKVKLRLLVKL